MGNKISQLTQVASSNTTDLVLISQDQGGGIFISKKITQRDFTSLHNNKVTSISYSANVTTDVSTGNIFRLNLTNNVNLKNPINAKDGTSYIWWIKQDATNTCSITLDTKFIVPSSATLPLAFSASGSKMDMLAAIYDGTNDKFYITSMVPGYS